MGSSRLSAKKKSPHNRIRTSDLDISVVAIYSLPLYQLSYARTSSCTGSKTISVPGFVFDGRCTTHTHAIGAHTRSRKRFEPAQYWGGGPPGNSVVLNPILFFFSRPATRSSVGGGGRSLLEPSLENHTRFDRLETYGWEQNQKVKHTRSSLDSAISNHNPPPCGVLRSCGLCWIRPYQP